MSEPTLSELFDRDPLQYTEQDLSTIIAYFREARAKFDLGAKQAGNAKEAKKPASLDVKLEDLGL